MISKLLQIPEDLINNSQDNGEISHIFKTKILAIKVFKVFKVFENKRITFEVLCQNLVSVESRTNIQSILMDGIKKIISHEKKNSSNFK